MARHGGRNGTVVVRVAVRSAARPMLGKESREMPRSAWKARSGGRRKGSSSRKNAFQLRMVVDTSQRIASKKRVFWAGPAWEIELNYFSRCQRKFLFFLFFGSLFCGCGWSQAPPLRDRRQIPRPSSEPAFDVSKLPAESFGGDAAPSTSMQNSDHHGFVSRMVKRGLEDQKELYLAPFKPSNFKWDAIVLGGTAGLSDRGPAY